MPNLFAPFGVVKGSILIGLSGTTYAVDANGYVANVSQFDAGPLIAAGWTVLNTTGDEKLIGKLTAANMNSTADQPFVLALQGPAASKLVVTRILVTNPSISLTTAAGGVYTAASKGGTAIVAAGQAYSGLTAATSVVSLTIAASLTQPAATAALILALTTAQGAAATADVYAYGFLLS